MQGNLPMAEERLSALDKACFLPCEEQRDLKRAVARYKAAGNKYVAKYRSAGGRRRRSRANCNRFVSHFDTPPSSIAFHTALDEASLRKVPMKLIAPARRFFALISRRALGPRIDDPAEHGHRLRPRRHDDARAGGRGSGAPRSRPEEPLRAPPAPPLQLLNAARRPRPLQTSRSSIGRWPTASPWRS